MKMGENTSNFTPVAAPVDWIVPSHKPMMPLPLMVPDFKGAALKSVNCNEYKRVSISLR